MPARSDDAQKARLILEGDRLGKAGDWAGALARYDRAILGAPRSARAHYHRAIALSKLGRKSELAAALEQVLSLDPEHDKARTGLSRIRGESRPFAAPVAPLPEGTLRAVGEDGIPVDWQAGDVILDLYEVKGIAGEFEE